MHQVKACIRCALSVFPNSYNLGLLGDLLGVLGDQERLWPTLRLFYKIEKQKIKRKLNIN